MNWQTAAILFAMVSVAVMPVMILYFGWEGLKMAMVGKQYGRTVRWILAIAFAVFLLIMAWSEIVYHPNGVAPL